MWPVNDQASEDVRGYDVNPGDATEDPPAEPPVDAEDRTPEEAGYGYGV